MGKLKKKEDIEVPRESQMQKRTYLVDQSSFMLDHPNDFTENSGAILEEYLTDQ